MADHFENKSNSNVFVWMKGINECLSCTHCILTFLSPGSWGTRFAKKCREYKSNYRRNLRKIAVKRVEEPHGGEILKDYMK